jgi:hypothetical protein
MHSTELVLSRGVVGNFSVEQGSARHIGPSVLRKFAISVYFSCFIYLEIIKKHSVHESRTNHVD